MLTIHHQTRSSLWIRRIIALVTATQFGGIKVIVAARASGTEEIYNIYAESFLGQDHLRQIEEEAQAIVSEALARGARTAWADKP